MYKLRISKAPNFINATQDELQLNLYDETNIGKIDYTISVGELRNDIEYCFELIASDQQDINEIKEFRCYINDEDTPFICESFTNGSNRFTTKKTVFSECYGLLQLTVVLLFHNKPSQELITGNISVIVQKDETTKQVENMIDYISENCEPLIYEKHSYSRITTGLKRNNVADLEGTVQILSDIANTYKACYLPLVNSAKHRYTPHNVIGPFEKVQTINHSTINYIVTHPEQLQKVPQQTSIKYNDCYYQPKQTLIRGVKKDYSVYENTVIVSFSKHLKDKITNTLLPKTKSLIESFPNTSSIYDENYINSAVVLFQRSKRKLEGLYKRLKTLEIEFRRIYNMYSGFLSIEYKKESIYAKPRYTETFRMNPVYHKLYLSINKWYNNGNYELKKESFILSFLKSSKIYEFYILLKLREAIKLVFGNAAKEESKKSQMCLEFDYNNMFVFSLPNNKRVELFFQPIIYTPKNYNGIGLIRNCKYNFEGREGGEEREDRDYYVSEEKESKIIYYTPDYLLKFVDNGKEKYIILDAKFSPAYNQMQHQIQKLSYKYIFSLSPADMNNKLLGICIICGKDKNNRDNQINTVYIDKDYSRLPFADFPTVTGKDTSETQTLFSLIKKYYNV